MKRNKIVVILLLLIISISSAVAKQEVWMDASFYADTENIPSVFKDKGYFNTYNEGNITAIKRIGPSFSITYFPSHVARIGLIASASTQFPVGYTASKNGSFTSYNFDYRQDFSVGLAYNQMFSSMIGMFLDASIGIQFNRIASLNERNDKTAFDYYHFATTNLVIHFGLLNKSDNVYFKIGGAFNYNLKNKAGLNYALLAGCGLIL